MSLDPPNGSKISVTTDGGDPVIVVPHARPGASRYFVGLILLVMIGIWYLGFSRSMSVLWSGNADVFFLLWLLLWTAVGAFPAYCLYRLFGPAVPELLRLRSNGMAYDLGVPPLQTPYRGGISFKEARKVYFPKRTRIELDRPLRLQETGSGNRLTVNAGPERLELARSANEIEREWLYRTFAKRYSLPPVPGGAAEHQA